MKTVIKHRRSLEYRLKKRLAPLRKAIVYYGNERRTRLKLPLGTRWRAWRLGFTSASYALYCLDENDPGNYLRDFSDIDYLMDHPEANTVNDKLNFARCLNRLDINTPEVIAVIRGGAVVWPSSSDQSTEPDLPSALEFLLKSERRLVFRPVLGGGGSGVLIVENTNGELRVNGETASFGEIADFIRNRRSFIVTRYVDQAGYASSVYPDSLNTMRILTIWDSEHNEPALVRAVHRFGSTHSYPMDHYHAGFGGVCAPVDLETGRLGPALSMTRDARVVPFERPPETDGPIAGVVLPFWQETRAAVLKAAGYFATSPYIGWDVAITETGPTFIEANSPPGPAILQAHEPLLEDKTIRRFYAEQGMI